MGVVGEQVDGPEHGDLPEFDDASVEGPEERHDGVHVEVAGEADHGDEQHDAPHLRRERLQRNVGGGAKKEPAEGGADEGWSN